MDSKELLIVVICFFAGFVISWLVGGKKKGSEGKYFPNFVVVTNTDIEKCSPDIEMCYHIHHWIFLAVLLAGYFSLNYMMGYSASVKYLYLISLYLAFKAARKVPTPLAVNIISTTRRGNKKIIAVG